ncbi:MAG: DUF1624 domain-containing protein [Oscillospiraceae bacterium]|nr:DUF1624 domain-containing protein [Oscillospiraceae bacterium]
MYKNIDIGNKGNKAIKANKKARIPIIDALRGLSIILMVAYHTGYDLVLFKLAPKAALYNPLLAFLQPFFAGVFIVLAGVSARYASNNHARGARVLACALIVSIVTGFIGVPVSFGILHCLGFCMVLCGDPATWVDKIPRKAQPLLFCGLFIACYLFIPVRGDIFSTVPYLYAFGFVGPTFTSADYFPLLPWLFLYLLGTWVGSYIKAGRFPRWFYNFRIPVLPVIGRHTLLIYMLHQPVVYLAVSLLAHILR